MTDGTKLAVSWIEFLLVILLTTLGMSFWVIAERLIRSSFASSEREAEDFAERHGVPAGQRRLSLAEAEWKASVASLVEQRLDTARQAAKLEALERSYPGLRGTPPTPAASVVPAEEVKEYRDAQRQLRAATALGERLATRLQEIETRLDQSATAARLARRAAARDWRADKIRGERVQRVWTFLWAAGASCLALLVAARVLSGSTAHRLGIQRGLVLGSTAALLLILYGYQILHGLSIALAIPLLLIGVWLLLRAYPADSSATGGAP